MVVIYCPNGCNVVHVNDESETDECASCGSVMSADGEDMFYHYREDIPIAEFEKETGEASK